MQGEVWLSWYPKEEDRNDLMRRPSLIVEEDGNDVIAIKLTKTPKRKEDPFDETVTEWGKAGLSYPSTARVSKVEYLPKAQLIRKLGEIDPVDENRIALSLQRYLNSLE